MNTNTVYDNAPMMDLNEYYENEGMALNTVNGEVLDMLYKIRQIIWVTEIHLTEDNEISNNYICPYVVIKIGNKYYLKNRTNADIYAPYEVKFKEYEFKNASNCFVLPPNVLASTSYQYTNRYRYEEYKKLLVQKREENNTTNKFEFTLKQVKQILAENFGCFEKDICIKL